MEPNHWRTAFWVSVGICALLLGESVTVRDEIAAREAIYQPFLASKLKNGKTIGQMIRPGSAAVFEYDGGAVICAVAR